MDPNGRPQHLEGDIEKREPIGHLTESYYLGFKSFEAMRILASGAEYSIFVTLRQDTMGLAPGTRWFHVLAAFDCVGNAPM
jgi:hypothetical protein